MVLTKGNPFPFLNAKTIHVCVNLEKGDKSEKSEKSDKVKTSEKSKKSDKGDKTQESIVQVGVIPLDESVRRFILLPEVEGSNKPKIRFALAEDLVMNLADTVFKNYRITGRTVFKLTRNADLDVDEASFDHDIDYREVMSELVRKRKKQRPVRIQLSDVFSLDALEFMAKKLPLKTETKQIFYTKSPLDFGFVSNIRDLVKDPELKFKKAVPQAPLAVNLYHTMFTQIRKNDILLCYPYESIKPFIKFLEESAEDKSVKSIQITL
jgi:polyphosphate kinase